MGVFLTEWLFVVAMLLAFGAAGGFALVPFRQRLPFWPLASPFAGLLVTAFGMAFGYLILGLPFGIGVAGTSAAGLAATIWTGRRTGPGPERPSSVRCGR